NVEDKNIDDNDQQGHHENKREEQDGKLIGLCGVRIAVTAKRQDRLQTRIIPGQQEQVRQQHERGNARSFKPDRVSQNTNIQDDGKVDDRSEKRRSGYEQQKRRDQLADADERVVRTRAEQLVEIMAQRIVGRQPGKP